MSEHFRGCHPEDAAAPEPPEGYRPQDTENCGIAERRHRAAATARTAGKAPTTCRRRRAITAGSAAGGGHG